MPVKKLWQFWRSPPVSGLSFNVIRFAIFGDRDEPKAKYSIAPFHVYIETIYKENLFSSFFLFIASLSAAETLTFTVFYLKIEFE